MKLQTVRDCTICSCRVDRGCDPFRIKGFRLVILQCTLVRMLQVLNGTRQQDTLLLFSASVLPVVRCEVGLVGLEFCLFSFTKHVFKVKQKQYCFG